MFATIEEIRHLIDAFETTRLPRAQWNHRTHLTLAAWYLTGGPEAEAADRVIGGIRRYNHAKGIGPRAAAGYHETHTLFWLCVARSHLRHREGDESRLDRINDLLRAFGHRPDFINEFYRDDTLGGDNARQRWVEPDRRPLEHLGRLCECGMIEDRSAARAAAARPDDD